MFFQILFLVSLAPYIILPFFFAAAQLPNTDQSRQAILFLGNAHIAITLYFFLDRQFLTIIRANPTRYIAAPVVAVIGSALTYALTPVRYEFGWWAIYTVWQNWHFGRQTFGVYAITAMDQTPTVGVSRLERLLIYGTVAMGAVGAIFFTTGGSAWHHIALSLRTWCATGTMGLAAVGLGYLLVNRQRFNANRALFFIFSLLFFGPQYLNTSIEGGFAVYSMSHSLQYLLFMSVLAFNVREEGGASNSRLPLGLATMLLFSGVALLGGVIVGIRGEFGTMLAAATGSVVLGRFVSGAMFGVVVAHFVVDADAWKLRKKPQRDFVLGRFNFLGDAASVESTGSPIPRVSSAS